MDFKGELEAHVTVRSDDVDGLALWYAKNALKLTHVVLSRGAEVSQPMLTLCAHTTLADMLSRAEHLTTRVG